MQYIRREADWLWFFVLIKKFAKYRKKIEVLTVYIAKDVLGLHAKNKG